jgi:hypothetical protein
MAPGDHAWILCCKSRTVGFVSRSRTAAPWRTLDGSGQGVADALIADGQHRSMVALSGDLRSASSTAVLCLVALGRADPAGFGDAVGQP